MNRLIVQYALFVLSAAFIGCSTSTTPLGGPAKIDRSNAPANNNLSSEITLRTVDIDGYNLEIQKHKGSVVLVDFWATWCIPCVEQFPHTVQLHEKYSGQGLAVLSLSFDDEGSEADVRNFLREQKAYFLNLRSEYGAGTESMEKFDLDAAVPHYRLYDHTGKLRESWNGEPDGIEQKIEELLKESP